ncbi:MAG: hypothetical protein M0Q43_08070 [Methanothrix sp.]|nr:hypothetical protein [Methanothrix sp.]
MALEATGKADRAQADGKQSHGAVDCQGDPGGGVLCPAQRGGGDGTGLQVPAGTKRISSMVPE